MGRLAILGSLFIVTAVIAMSSCARARRVRGGGRFGFMNGAGGVGVPVGSDEERDLDQDEREPDIGESRRPDPAPVVCFIRGRAFARPGSLRFTAGTVPLNMCTHIVYSFLETDNKTGNYIFRKQGGDREDAILRSLVSLKKRKRNLKVLFSYGEGAHTNSLLNQLHSKQAQATFVHRTRALLSYFGLDGVNFHLEGPAPSVCNKEKARKILEFIQALRARLGRNFLITFQLPACRKGNCAPPMKEFSRHLDYLFLMTFDYKLDDLSKTKLTSGLYYYEGDRKTAIETESCLDRWVNDDVPKYKIIPGIATYGRSFTLNNPKKNGVSAKLKKRHPLGYGANFTKTDGYMDYVETCRRVKYFDWNREWVKYAATPYIYYKDQWVSYDDVDSVDVKAKWFRAHWYGGIFVWSLDADDYLGNCVGELFPMVHAAWKPLKGYRPLASKGEDVDVTAGSDGNVRKQTQSDMVGPDTRKVTRGQAKKKPPAEENCSGEEEDGTTNTPWLDTASTQPVVSTTESSTETIIEDTLSTTTGETPATYSDYVMDTTTSETRVPRCPICPCSC